MVRREGIVWAAIAGMLLLGTPLCAKVESKRVRYGIEKGIIHYKIDASGMIDKDLNWTLRGNATRCFHDYGASLTYRKHIDEYLNGSFRYHAKADFMTAQEGETSYVADYRTKRIIKQHLPLKEEMPPSMHYVGQQMVGNVVCDLWEGPVEKLCLYKGVPILKDYQALGFHYREEALDATFNPTRKTLKECEKMPEFPLIQTFALYRRANAQIPQQDDRMIGEKILEALEKVTKDPSSANKDKMFHKELQQEIFHMQQRFLENLLKTLEKSRMCFQKAENTIDANVCLSDLHALEVKYLGDDKRRRVIVNWQEERDGVSEHFEKSIASLRAKMPCIKRAKQLHDINMCLQQ